MEGRRQSNTLLHRVIFEIFLAFPPLLIIPRTILTSLLLPSLIPPLPPPYHIGLPPASLPCPTPGRPKFTHVPSVKLYATATVVYIIVTARQAVPHGRPCSLA